MDNDLYEMTAALCSWYADNKRDLPWRDTKDAYVIWLSEIILQQTRVEQGLPYFYQFMTQYPTVYDFARADQDEVLKLWQGLGYYSRARNMQVAAQTIVEEHSGIFPSDYKKIRILKGVGDYTAAAILSFAYDLPYAVVDGNVMRVFSRLFAIEEPVDTAVGKKIITKLAQKYLDKEDPAIYNQAIMDFGALVCTPKSPKCSECPLISMCEAKRKDMVSNYPIKKNKTKIRSRYFNYIVARQNNNVLIQRRDAKDIWQGLYEFPLLETTKRLADEELIKEITHFSPLHLQTSNLLNISQWKKQILSHQHIYYRFIYIESLLEKHVNDKIMSIDLFDIASFAVPKPIEKEIERILSEDL